MKLLLPLLLLSSTLLGYELHHTTRHLSDNEQELTLTFKLDKNEYLYKESLLPSINTKEATLSPLTTSSPTLSFFDETYQKQKEGYTGTVIFKTTVTRQPNATQENLLVHTHFMVSSDTQPHEQIITLTFPALPATMPTTAPVAKSDQVAQNRAAIACAPQQPSLAGNLIQKSINVMSVMITQAQNTLAGLFSKTGSRFIRLLAALLLGILLSLTPCIYPMIPITIGILQASGSKSTWHNFLLAFCYTLGISTTYAIFGFITALGSCVFGEIQGSPFLIIPLALALFFFGLTMFDVVQMPIPSWLQPKTAKVQGGSKGAAYLYGAISGTVASPCMSPGLFLILNYVTSISAVSVAAYLEAFLLLFVFGIGSSMPLLLIGTFSGSINSLPKAGAWMVEIKKIIGIMLIALALYHLSHLERLLPWYLFVWVTVITFIILGTYYFYSIQQYDSKGIKRYKNSMGVGLIVVGALLGVQGQKAFFEHFYPDEQLQVWSHSYQTALAQARKDKKLLFIDIGASYCSACKALDVQIFGQQQIQDALALFTLLKIESDIQVESYEEVKKQFPKEIVGYPTYLVVDPEDMRLVKKWTIDIDQMSLEGIEQELRKLAESYQNPT